MDPNSPSNEKLTANDLRRLARAAGLSNLAISVIRAIALYEIDTEEKIYRLLREIERADLKSQIPAVWMALNYVVRPSSANRALIFNSDPDTKRDVEDVLRALENARQRRLMIDGEVNRQLHTQKPN